MRVDRSMLLGLAALVAAVGMLGANGYFWWVAQSKRSATVQASELAANNPPNNERSPLPAESQPWVSPYRPQYREFEQDPLVADQPARQYFPHQTNPFEMAQAQDSPSEPVPLENPDSAPKPSANAPAPLPWLEQAAPLPNPAANYWLEPLIQRELPNASAEEQQVWLEELKGLDPETALGILRMRKTIPGGPTLPRLGHRNESQTPSKPAAPWNWQTLPDAGGPIPRGLVPKPPEPELVQVPPADLKNRPVPASPDPRDSIPAFTEKDNPLGQRLQPSVGGFEQARDVVLNNLANAQTPGFKRSRLQFSPLPYHTLPTNRMAQDDLPDEYKTDSTPAVGWGVELSGTPLDMSQGALKKTGQPLDVALEGAGFFQLRLGHDVFYSRCGMWSLNETGQLCLLSGQNRLRVEPPITVPINAGSIVIDDDGRVIAREPQTEGLPQARELGRLVLSRFRNPQGLKPLGGHLFAATKASGQPRTGNPGTKGFAVIHQGLLELSNVESQEELEQFQTIQSHFQLLKSLAGTPRRFEVPGPVADHLERTRRVSHQKFVLPPNSLESLKLLKAQGQHLFGECLQTKPVQNLKRKLGLK